MDANTIPIGMQTITWSVAGKHSFKLPINVRLGSQPD